MLILPQPLSSTSQLILNMQYFNKRTKFKITTFESHETCQVRSDVLFIVHPLLFGSTPHEGTNMDCCIRVSTVNLFNNSTMCSSPLSAK